MQGIYYARVFVLDANNDYIGFGDSNVTQGFFYVNRYDPLEDGQITTGGAPAGPPQLPTRGPAAGFQTCTRLTEAGRMLQCMAPAPHASSQSSARAAPAQRQRSASAAPGGEAAMRGARTTRAEAPRRERACAASAESAVRALMALLPRVPAAAVMSAVCVCLIAFIMTYEHIKNKRADRACTEVFKE